MSWAMRPVLMVCCDVLVTRNQVPSCLKRVKMTLESMSSVGVRPCMSAGVLSFSANQASPSSLRVVFDLLESSFLYV